MKDIFALLKNRQTAPTPAGPVEYIIAGLGNPGAKYEKTRHNAGFLMIAEIAKRFNVTTNKIKFDAVCADAEILGKHVLLMKPTTFMNLSGKSVQQAANFYKIPPEKVFIIYDDISLDVGKMRIRLKGSHGGHNGMRNIIELSGKDTFPRIKIGVGKKPHPDWDLADWVLSEFSKDDLILLDSLSKNVIDAIELMINENPQQAMNLYNR